MLKTNKDFVEMFTKCEAKIEVSAWKYYGIDVWPIVKWHIFTRNFPKNHTGSLSLKNFVKSSWLLITSFLKLCFSKRRYDSVLVSQGQRTLFEDKYLDPLLDPIKDSIEKDGKSCFYIESSFDIKTPKHATCLQFRLIEAILYAFSSLLPSHKLDLKDFEKFKEITAGESFSIGEEFLKTLKARIKAIYYISRFYRLLLKMITPQSVYIVCYYNIASTAILLAARSLNIKVIDVQHGSNMNNFAYVGWSLVPAGGYNTIPDAFWNWSNFDVEELNSTNSQEFLSYHRPFLGGFPWMKSWMEYSETTRKYDEIIDKISDSRDFKILVLYRPSLFGEEKKWKELADLIQELPDEWFWMIRKHPSYNEREFPFTDQMQNNINITQVSSLPLYALFRRCSLVITTSSNASALEAYCFGKKTVFISKVALEEAGELIQKIGSVVIEEKEKLKEFLIELSSNQEDNKFSIEPKLLKRQA